MKPWTAAPFVVVILLLPAATAQAPSSHIEWGFEDSQLDLDQYGRGIAPLPVRVDWSESVCVNAALVNIEFAVGKMPSWAGASLYPSHAKFPVPAGNSPSQSWNKTLRLEVAWNLDATGDNTSNTYNVTQRSIQIDGGPCNIRFWSVNATRPSIDVFLPRRATPTPDPLEQPALTNLTFPAEPLPTSATAEPTSAPLVLATVFAVLAAIGTKRVVGRRP